MGHFWWKGWNLGHFGGQNDVIVQNLGEYGEQIVSVKVYKNYFSQVYGHKFGQKCH